LKAMVLAAGRGERMRPLTDTTPKPLLTVAGKPLIVWHLEALARAGVRDVVINLSWLGERLRACVGDGNAYGVRVAYSEEGPVPLETAGGIFRALPLLAPGPFLVVNGDVWTDLPFATLTLPAQAHAYLALVPNPEHHPQGDFPLGVDGRIGEGDGQRFTYSGVGVYRPEFFAGCTPGRFPLLPLLNRARAAQRLYGEVYRGRWSDVGTPARLAGLDAELAAVE
jgi:MurNAc alpha-1-phosphate uridylyltransferase